MKLLMCLDCGDVFNLNFSAKSCSCGKVKGQYVNQRDAVVNGEGVSLAIGNGSLRDAIWALADMKEDFRDKGDPWARHPTSLVAWVRPHEGPANPHTTVV